MNSLLEQSGKPPIAPSELPRKQRQWPVVRGILLLVSSGIFIVAVGFLYQLYQSFQSQVNKLYDEDYAALVRALSERWGHDDSMPSASTGFDTSGTSNKLTEVWLAIELSYTGICNSTASSNPCEELANEFASIVFNNYGKVNNLTGIRIVIARGSHYLYVESSDILLEKKLSIKEWQKILPIQDEQSTGERKNKRETQ